MVVAIIDVKHDEYARRPLLFVRGIPALEDMPMGSLPENPEAIAHDLLEHFGPFKHNMFSSGEQFALGASWITRAWSGSYNVNGSFSSITVEESIAREMISNMQYEDQSGAVLRVPETRKPAFKGVYSDVFADIYDLLLRGLSDYYELEHDHDLDEPPWKQQVWWANRAIRRFQQGLHMAERRYGDRLRAYDLFYTMVGEVKRAAQWAEEGQSFKLSYCLSKGTVKASEPFWRE